jgi:hypothetical protein
VLIGQELFHRVCANLESHIRNTKAAVGVQYDVAVFVVCTGRHGRAFVGAVKEINPDLMLVWNFVELWNP